MLHVMPASVQGAGLPVQHLLQVEESSSALPGSFTVSGQECPLAMCCIPPALQTHPIHTPLPTSLGLYTSPSWGRQPVGI